MNRHHASLGLTAVLVALGFAVSVAQDRPPQAPPQQERPPRVGAMAPQTTEPAVTYSKDVAPILYRSCTTCHHPGTAAPMSLLTYKESRPHAKAIRDKVLDREMPPWHADAHAGTFANERLLTDDERRTLVTWANTGSKEGDPKDLPSAPTYPDTWAIGTPDLVVTMPQEYEVPAEGIIEYQWFTAQSGLTEDRWVKAMEVRSTGGSAVHHVVVFEQAPRQIRRERVVMVEPKYVAPTSRSSPPEGFGGALLMLTASNTGPHVFREGTSRILRAGTIVTFQVHYTANGQATKDRTSIGFVFAKEPPRQEIRLASFGNGSFVIPPGAPNHRVDAEMNFVADAKLWSIAPHTHLRGKSFEYTLVFPDGRRQVVLSVPKYDFEWQTEYEYTEPIKVPKGTKLLATAHYDNSRENHANPDPTAEVRWGDQTWEEMQFSWVTYSAETPATPPTAGPAGAAAPGAAPRP